MVKRQGRLEVKEFRKRAMFIFRESYGWIVTVVHTGAFMENICLNI